MQQNYRAEIDLGYAQITVATATLLTVPTNCSLVLVTPETQAVRWRADGTDPTAAVGYPLAAGVELRLTLAQISKVKFIEQTASAKLNVYYFGYA